MPSFQRLPPSTDAKISELPEGRARIKIVGSIVNVTPISIVVNDGTGQVILQLNQISSEDMSVGTIGRFIADVIVKEDNCTGSLIAWNEFTAPEVKQYQRLVKIERRIPRE